MAIKKTTRTKKPAYASGCGSSVPATAEMPPHGPGGANQIQPPPPPLPPGVYFSPTRDECLGFLNRRIAGDSEMADARGYIFDANVYGESPNALRQRHPPASIRGRGEHTWWFLSETRFQSKTVGGGASKRADRRVETGGYWRLEQSKERLKQIKERLKQRKQSKKQSEEEEEDEADGVKNCFGFYVGRDDKTPWLMQEFTSANDDGAGKLGVPALYRVYVTPRATRKQLTGVFRKEDDVKKGPDGKKKHARAMVPQGYFDRIASLLPEGSVRAVVQAEHVQAPSPSPPVAPVAVGHLDYHGQHQHGQYLGQYEQQQGQQYLGQYEQQQQGPCSVVAPPATPGLLGEFAAAEAPPDNLSMSMVEFMRMLNEQPAGIVNEQPAETVKEGEPDWGYLPDADEFKNFNDEG